MKSNPLKSQAKALVQKLEQERAGRTLMMNQVVKTQSTTPIVMASEPALQAAIVEYVVETYAKFGTPKGKKIKEWFRDNAVPTAGANVVRLLLRRQLPFTDAMFAGMFEKLSRTSFLSLVEFNEQLAGAFQKHAAKNAISARLRKAAASYADAISLRRLTKAEAFYWKDEWGFPSAEDKRVAARIDKALRH